MAKPQKVEITTINPKIYTIEDFIEDSQGLIVDLCTTADNRRVDFLDVLLTVYDNRKARTRLHHISSDGEEEERDWYSIGSGSPYANMLLNKFWKSDMTIEQILKLAYFCIFFVQDLNFDDGVGVENDNLPDNRVILNDGTFGEFTGFKKHEKEIADEIKNKIIELRNNIDNLKFE
jgi:20S proteasome alpha/beta subunit